MYLTKFNFDIFNIHPYREEILVAWDSVDLSFFIEFNNRIERTKKTIILYNRIFIFFEKTIVIAVPKAHLNGDVCYLYNIQGIFTETCMNTIFEGDLSLTQRNKVCCESQHTLLPSQDCIAHINIFKQFIKKYETIFIQYINQKDVTPTATVIGFAENRHFGQFLLNVLPGLSYILSFTKDLIIFKYPTLDLSQCFNICYTTPTNNEDWVECMKTSCENAVSHIPQIVGVSPVKPKICKLLQSQYKKNTVKTNILIDLKIDWRSIINQVDWVSMIVEESIKIHKNCVFYIGGYIQYIKTKKTQNIDSLFSNIFEEIKKSHPNVQFINIINQSIDCFIETASNIDFFFTTIGSLHHVSDAFCDCIGFAVGTYSSVWDGQKTTFPMYTLPNYCYSLPDEQYININLAPKALSVARARISKHNKKDANFFIKIEESRPFVRDYLLYKNFKT